MTFPKPSSISPATDSHYADVYSRLMKSAMFSHPEVKGPAIMDCLVGDLIESKPTRSAATFRLYKAATIRILTVFCTRTTGAPLSDRNRSQIQSAIDRLGAEPSSGCLKKSSRTSAAKSKSFPNRDAELVSGYLESPGRRSRSAKPTLLAMRVLGLLGTRPSELAKLQVTTLGPGCAEVQILNAKATNGRGLGESRTLSFENLSDQDLSALQQWNATLAEVSVNSTPGAAIKTLSRYFRGAVRRALGKRPRYPAFYSLRHQFAADAKASGCSLPEIAGLMGHASDTTASKHYGRKVSGRKGLKARASATDVARVRRRAKTFKPGNGNGNTPR